MNNEIETVNNDMSDYVDIIEYSPIELESEITEETIDSCNNTEYREFLERLRIEFSNFQVMAEKGATVPYSALNSRKQSKSLEKLLLDFRKISRRNEATIKADRKKQKEDLIKKDIGVN